MPSEMHERGRRDAEADALDESFYQYYYEYKQAYDEVIRLRRKGERRRFIARWSRRAVWLVPLVALLSSSIWGLVRWRTTGVVPLVGVRPTPTATPTRTPRPTLVPPTATPTITPTPRPALAKNSFALINTGTNEVSLRAHASPGKDTPITARLTSGKQVKILEGPQQADGLMWWRVEGDEGRGWAAADFLTPLTKR